MLASKELYLFVLLLTDKKKGTDKPKDMADPVTEQKKKQYPGLCLPDNADTAKDLLKSITDGGGGENKDLEVAKDALSEVCVCVCVWGGGGCVCVQ